jgi:hypothetical protein
MCHVSCHEDAGEFIDLCAPVLRSPLKLLREIHTRDLRKDLHCYSRRFTFLAAMFVCRNKKFSGGSE